MLRRLRAGLPRPLLMDTPKCSGFPAATIEADRCDRSVETEGDASLVCGTWLLEFRVGVAVSVLALRERALELEEAPQIL